MTTIDATRRQGRITLSDAPARQSAPRAPGPRHCRKPSTGPRWLWSPNRPAAPYAQQMATDYARTRYQFGRAIGSFQAVKHMCVDMLLEAQSALSAARHVASAFDTGSADRLTDLALAQSFCSEAFVSVAATAIQVHGGIGFTWEHPARAPAPGAHRRLDLRRPGLAPGTYVRLSEGTEDELS